MEYRRVNPEDDLSVAIEVLNRSHGTVAAEFGFNKETNPTNNAFIDEQTLKTQLEGGIELYTLEVNGDVTGCIAIEKSKKETDTFYIEKVSVLPEHRHRGYGKKLMEFAERSIEEKGGKWISIALIDSNARLKKWYLSQGYRETGSRDFPHLPFRVCFMNKKIELP